MNKLEKIKKENIKDHIPIIMDDTLEKIYEIIGNKKLDRILEIGTAHGYSALCFSKMLSEQGKIDTIERSHDNVEKAIKNVKTMKLDKKINIIEGDAVDVLPTINNKYDLIFIDAAKGKYPFFLEQSLRLIKKGGIIFADNILYKGYVMSDYNKHKQRTAVTHLREYIKLVTENQELETEILDIGDGLAVSKMK
ncbi:MAG: O-methyltransferase [Clostridia bacterium]|nr:O-methyltransferase [Clostridia bacterium]